MAKTPNPTPKQQQVTIAPPNFQMAVFTIRGTTPYCQCKFSTKAMEAIRQKQELGSVGTKGRKLKPRDFNAMYEGGKHRSREGWCGIPASAFRNSMISACKVTGFVMTRAKLCVFVEADGYEEDATPLVRITKGEPRVFEAMGRNANGGFDIRVRPLWEPGWEAKVRIRFDADQFNLKDVTNLLMRSGMQVGIGEGRPDSKQSAGLGFGLFELYSEKTDEKAD